MSECDIPGCYMVCEEGANVTTSEDRVRLKFMTDPYGTWIQSAALDFEIYKQGGVAIDIIETPWNDVQDNIVNEAISRTGLMDGFITAPGVSGSVVPHDGWADLTSFISETAERTADWADILLGYRKYIAQYEDQIIMYPLDGDVLSMFYRKDILEHFGLPVPRTWDEYSNVIQQVHGKTYENETLVGSCVGRSCAVAHWVYLMLSSMTQTNGPGSGHSFDTQDMKLLTGVALEQAIAWLEDHVLYGAEDEFDQCIQLNADLMNAGKCVLTYNWGNSFKQYLQEGSTLRGDKFGVAATPGSTKVLDRETMTLVECDEERCKNGAYYDDIGWVNFSPYLAYGGYACSVNNYTDPVRKRLATEFCAFTASQAESRRAVIPNATGADDNGQDPFRRSHLNITLFETQGYETAASKEYIEAIEASLDASNAVIDNRFPTANDLDIVLRRDVPEHLKAVKGGIIPDSELIPARRQLVLNIESQWREIIQDYEALPTTKVPILESYQRLRGVYAPEVDYHYLGNIKVYGHILVAVTLGASLFSLAWVLRYRKTRIMQASQPIFLILISVGVAILGSSIVSLGIDDDVARIEAASRACMSIPWLLAIGWTFVFAAIFSKLNRINMVFSRASRFRRVAIRERDVLHYFLAMLVTNVALMIAWTVVSPLEWIRIPDGPSESYGKCSIGKEETASNVIMSLLFLVNGFALVLSNIAAYRARRIATEYSESRYIALAMLSILQIVIVGVPVLFLVQDNPTARYFIMSSIVFILGMSILLWMYVPKMLAMHRQKDHGTLQRQMSSPGLAFRVRESGFLFDTNQSESPESHFYKMKLAALESILQEQGVDAEQIFKEVGFDSFGSHSFHLTQGKSSGSSKRSAHMRGIPESGEDNSPLETSSKMVETGSSKAGVSASNVSCENDSSASPT